MDEATSQKISALLSDPETMSKISAVINGLSGSAGGAQSNSPGAPSVPAFSVPAASGGKTELLNALKPLLREEKQNKIDKLMRALTIASVFRNFKGGQ